METCTQNYLKQSCAGEWLWKAFTFEVFHFQCLNFLPQAWIIFEIGRAIILHLQGLKQSAVISKIQPVFLQLMTMQSRGWWCLHSDTQKIRSSMTTARSGAGEMSLWAPNGQKFCTQQKAWGRGSGRAKGLWGHGARGLPTCLSVLNYTNCFFEPGNWHPDLKLKSPSTF